jgi:hypothetical protein
VWLGENIRNKTGRTRTWRLDELDVRAPPICGRKQGRERNPGACVKAAVWLREHPETRQEEGKQGDELDVPICEQTIQDLRVV